MKKVLVAGSTGYLGKYVVKEFKKQGYWIRALARNPKKIEEDGPFMEPAIKNDVDEVFVGDVTKPETLQEICDGIDIVFSSVGITRQKDRLTFRDVDYQGNKNILDITRQKSIEKFIFVSISNVHLFRHLEIVKCREEFVDDLKKSGLNYTVIRPTGYFSDISEFLKMAISGKIYLLGDGKNKINPIHGADLAKVCVDGVINNKNEISVGGPEIYTGEEIAEMAFSVIKTPPKITKIPVWSVNIIIKTLRIFNKQKSDLIEFILTTQKNDVVAPPSGKHSLKNYFEEMAVKLLRKGS